LAKSDPLRLLGAYEKELFKFFSSNFPAYTDLFFNRILAENFGYINTDFMTIAKKVVPNFLLKSLENADSGRISVTFAVLKMLEKHWEENNGRRFNEIEPK
jgi:hypothetical protein